MDHCLTGQCPCASASRVEADAILAALDAAGMQVVDRKALEDAITDLSEHSEPYGRQAIESAYRKLRAMLAAAKEDRT